MTRPVLLALLGLFSLVLLLTLAFRTLVGTLAAARRRRFLGGLGGIVRIGTPCRVVTGGDAPVPGTLALTPRALSWDAPFGLSGQVPLDGIRRLETDERLQSGRRLLVAQVIRMTPEAGRAREFLVSPAHAIEWRRALGEWVAARGRA